MSDYKISDTQSYTLIMIETYLPVSSYMKALEVISNVRNRNVKLVSLSGEHMHLYYMEGQYGID